jgi:hypothetical protein
MPKYTSGHLSDSKKDQIISPHEKGFSTTDTQQVNHSWSAIQDFLAC